MAYTPTTWNTGDDVTATKLNKLENGVANAGGYDLVLTYDYTVQPNTCTVTYGDILDCEDKMDNGELVTGVCIIKGAWSWTPSGSNTNHIARYIPLVNFEGPYRVLMFGGIAMTGTEEFNYYGLYVQYDGSTGAITNFVIN